MRNILLIAGLVALAASPALAASGKKRPPSAHHVQSRTVPSAPMVGMGGSLSVQSYTGNRIVGRDPDPNIRQMLQAEDAFFRNTN